MEEELYLGAVYDAMYALGHKVKDFYIDLRPMAGYSQIISGPAFTTYGRLVNKDEDYEIVDQSKYSIFKKQNFVNNPVVLLQSNDDYCAHFGEMTAFIYKNLGAVGLVTDGNVRDLEFIDKYKFPVFCEGSNPIDALDHWSLVNCNIPITMKNVIIEPEDWIYASKEGVIRVKKSDLLEFQMELFKILKKEKETRKYIAEFARAPDFADLIKEFSSQNGRW